MTDRSAPFRPGDSIMWIDEAFTDGHGWVRPGEPGTFVDLDGFGPRAGYVVDFPEMGLFCCERECVQRVDEQR